MTFASDGFSYGLLYGVRSTALLSCTKPAQSFLFLPDKGKMVRIIAFDPSIQESWRLG